MKIIPDTNIWYHIAEKRYSHGMIKELPLYLTGWNVLELIASPKLIRSKEDRNAVLNACRAILFLKPDVIPFLPPQYIAMEILDYRLGTPIGMDKIEALVCGEYSEADINDFIALKRQLLQGFKVSMDEQQKSFREKIVPSMKPTSGIEMLTNIYVQTIKEVQDNLGITFDSIKHIDLAQSANKIGVFLKTREAENNILMVSEKGVKKNDFGDLLNMVYVNQGDKYWSNDKKWLEKIHWEGIENYLFSPTE